MEPWRQGCGDGGGGDDGAGDGEGADLGDGSDGGGSVGSREEQHARAYLYMYPVLRR